MPPAVSVIVPAYNVSAYIGETLESLFAQHFTDFEAIVIDDGSSDRTEFERSIEKFRSRIILIEQNNLGPGAARNEGLRVAQGSLVSFLDGDDQWEPLFLDRMMTEWRKRSGIAVLYADAKFFGDAVASRVTAMQRSPSRGPVTFEKVISLECTVMLGASLSDREAIMRAGGFDARLRGTEDLYLWLKVLKQGGKIEYLREPLMRYRQREGSLTRERVSLSEQIVKALEQARIELEPTEDERRAIEKRLELLRAEILLHRGRKEFFAGDAARAAVDLEAANRYFQSWKLRAVVLGMRAAPGLLLAAYRLRDRYFFKANTAF
jgi:GT2 family glycosyltransferase